MNTFRMIKLLLLWMVLASPAAAQILKPTHLSTALSRPTAKVLSQGWKVRKGESLFPRDAKPV